MEKIKVIIADDSDFVRDGMRIILSVDEEFEVLGCAANGKEAIELAKNTPPDVFLMDIQMPEMDGIEATEYIVEHGLGKVLILTTFDDYKLVQQALKCGAKGYLIKNHTPEHLKQMIKSVYHGTAVMEEGFLENLAIDAGWWEREQQEAKDTGAAGAGQQVAGRRAESRQALGQQEGSIVMGERNKEDSTEADRVAGAGQWLAGWRAGSQQVAGQQEGSQQAERFCEEGYTARELDIVRAVAEGLSNREIAAKLFLSEGTVKNYITAILAKENLSHRTALAVYYLTGKKV